MIAPKLKVGDKVVPSRRAPMWLMEGLRKNRYRTVVSVLYDRERRCSFYMLGFKPGNQNYIGAYAFRSYQLNVVVVRPVGRPRERRVYRPSAAIPIEPANKDGRGLIVAPLPLRWGDRRAIERRQT